MDITKLPLMGIIAIYIPTTNVVKVLFPIASEYIKLLNLCHLTG